MKVFITGVAGFIGTNLVLRLLGKGEDVIGVDSLCRRGSEVNLKYIKNKFPNFKLEKRDILDAPNLIIAEKPDLVYHFAAQVAVTSSVESPKRDFDINAAGTLGIVLAAKEIGAPVIYTSTNKVFGDNVNNVPISEQETRWDFVGELQGKGIDDKFSIDASHHTPYGISKLVGDLYVREYGGVSNRCSCMYGPHQNGIVDQGWLSHIAKKIINKEQVTIYGDGKQVRDALHSDDVVNLLELQAKALTLGNPDIRGEAFAIGGGYENTISLIELCNEWRVKKEELNFEDWRPADQKVFYCDISKAKRVLGWEPKIGLKRGLEELYSWTQKNMLV